MIQIVHDFDRFDHLPQATPWQKRIRGELRFVQTLSEAADGKSEKRWPESWASISMTKTYSA